MYQHQHAPLALERLKDVPQPVALLLEMLLEKDPESALSEGPGELLKAIPTVTGPIDARRRTTRQSLLKGPSTASRVGTRKPPERTRPKKVSIARLPVTGSDVFGREEDIAFLDRAWANTGCQCRYHRCQGPGCRQVHARQPLATTDGC